MCNIWESCKNQASSDCLHWEDNDLLELNEHILVKLDMLNLELSKVNSSDDKDILEMAELKELEDIISDAKYYK